MSLPNTFYITKLQKLLNHPIGNNSLPVYPHFGIEPFYPRLQENFVPFRPSGEVDKLVFYEVRSRELDSVAENART